MKGDKNLEGNKYFQIQQLVSNNTIFAIHILTNNTICAIYIFQLFFIPKY